MQSASWITGRSLLLLFLLVFLGAPAAAQDTQDDPPASPNAAASQVTAVVVSCASKPGERTQCAADTSAGVVLLRSMGDAPCLLGRTWGYDQTSVWVSDGCSAEFGTGSAVEPETTNPKPLSHIPNVGFLLFAGDKGEIYFRLFSYGRYLNQRNLDPILRRRLRQREDRAAATGHPAAEILRTVLGLVPHPEDALLPLRLVVESLAR